MAHEMNTLWFVKFYGPVGQVVFNFTLPEAETEEQAFAYGERLIADAFRAQYRRAEATRLCRTRDSVLVFEPC